MGNHLSTTQAASTPGRAKPQSQVSDRGIEEQQQRMEEIAMNAAPSRSPTAGQQAAKANAQQPMFGVNYANNTAMSNYDVTRDGLPLEQYDDTDDDVFDRNAAAMAAATPSGGGGGGVMNSYAYQAAAAVGGATDARLHPLMTSAAQTPLDYYNMAAAPDYIMKPPCGYNDVILGYGMPQQLYYSMLAPAAMAASAAAPEPQRELMRYVECLQDGVLAVWGDETSPDFNAQFSKQGTPPK